MTLARVAAQLDPATELEDFQAAARTLLAHPLVTERFPEPGALAAVRRFEEPLRNEFDRLCHWRLDIGPRCARLLRRPAGVAPTRPARTATQSRRPFTPWAYACLCLVLAALESLGDQTTISHLADEVGRLRAGDHDLPFDLTNHGHRRAFVDAVAWLEERGVLTVLDGDTESFVSRGGDALYDIDTDAAGRLLLSPPSVLAGITSPEQFLDERYSPTPEGEAARVRHRVHRRLLTEPALYYDELPEPEREYARQRRTRIREELERLTGGVLECRAEGQALLGVPAATSFPGASSVTHAALLFGGELVVSGADGPDGFDKRDEFDKPDKPDGADGADSSVGRFVPATAADAAWHRVVAGYLRRFTAEYRDDPDRLRRHASALLARLDLVHVRPDGGALVRPTMARYRADVRLPETLGV